MKKNNIKIEKAYPIDFEEIYRFLRYMNKSKSKDEWKLLFENSWDSPEKFIGYKVVKQNEIIGYSGVVFVKRKINGVEVKIANRTSNIIKPEYRGRGIAKRMLKHLNDELEGDYTIITTSGNGAIVHILKNLGHIDYATHARFFLPTFFFNKKYRLVTDFDEIRLALSDDDVRIFDDHKGFKNKFFMVKYENEYLFVIFNKIYKKNIPLGKVVYINNYMLFNKIINNISLKICFKYKILSIFYLTQSLKNENRSSFFLKLSNPRIFKSTTLKPEDIDELYSEVVLLNL